MGCTTYEQSIFFRVLLTVDVVVYLVYAWLLTLPRSKEEGKIPLERVIQGFITFNVFVIVWLVLLVFISQPLSFSFQSIGIALAAVIVILVVRAASSAIISFLLHGLLLIAAQLSNIYLPPVISGAFGISTTAATSITVFVPIVLLLLLEVILQSHWIATICTMAFVSVLVALSIAVFSADFSWKAPVCCDVFSGTNGCPVWITSLQTLFIIILLVILVLIDTRHRMYQTLRNLYQRCRRCCSRKKKQQTQANSSITEETPLVTHIPLNSSRSNPRI